ncbi:hypothetical protein EJ05DRAFT_481729 [Pseudovirgaria hyperparasitica]|uniref:Uncharacterized protein n=1 Tax=Pseudovirgaria hyperparasitica TaxID=470096 RepID=A0A6A6WL09_9PEZI|nr:uncharacterized protein EJ05DRAFT_481729 [Pseudovirgaria hyperparasitica]KAF2762852.1 hypothetical protein EJ05DRAFT_481729 [Pseudovirgaria hyperparasitica]
MDNLRRHHSVGESLRPSFSHRHAVEDTEWYSTPSVHNTPPYAQVDSTRPSDATTIDEAPDHPPTYTASDNLLPSYAPADPSIPLQTYTLVQVSRSLQILLPTTPSTSQPAYRLITRSSPKLFSKRADITLVRSTAATYSTKIVPECDVEVAHANYNDAPILPWMPRGTITTRYAPTDIGLGDAERVSRTYTLPMQSRNFKDWTIAFALPSSHNSDDGNPGQHAGPAMYVWRLTPLPSPTFTLMHLNADVNAPIATFTHTVLGTRATSGAEVGHLHIHIVHVLPAGPDVEMVMASLALVMGHFRRIGRQHYGVARGFDHFGADTREVRGVGPRTGQSTAVPTRSLSVADGRV